MSRRPSLAFAAAAAALAALLACAHGAIQAESARVDVLQKEVKTNPIIAKSPSRAKAEATVAALQKKVIEQGCNLNACFAIDGSVQISKADFRKQLQFVGAVAAIAGLDPQFHAAAFQYSLVLRKISGMTRDISTFIEDVEGTAYKPDRNSFIAPAIIHCSHELRNGFPTDANTLVLIGDGRSTFFGQDFSVARAAKFLPPHNNGAITAVTVGDPDTKFWTRITQNEDRVIPVDDYDSFFSILGQVVTNVCSLV